VRRKRVAVVDQDPMGRIIPVLRMDRIIYRLDKALYGFRHVGHGYRYGFGTTVYIESPFTEAD
jgi:hypothetical protein